MPDDSFKKLVHSVRPQAGRYSRALPDVCMQAMFGTV